jgi:GNAT superfamily N-acetyltransferase
MNKPSLIKLSSTLPTETRIEHLSNDVGLPEKEVLSLLKASMGGDDTPPWPANQRWLIWHSDKLIAHVSVQRRWFVVNKHYFEGWHVGGVCVHPGVQGKGVGTFLMERAHADLSRQELGFAVLNCGRPLIRFYKRVGYIKVSDRAMYIRDDGFVIDEDPALAISFQPAFDVGVLKSDAFPFGFDF